VKRIGSLLVLVVFVVALAYALAYSEPLTLADGYLTDKSGQPIANQTLIVHGRSWTNKWAWLPFGPKTEKEVKFIAVTDSNGYVQFVNLPAGDYMVKVVRPDSQPVTVTGFNLPPHYTNEKLNLNEFVPKTPAPQLHHPLDRDR